MDERVSTLPIVEDVDEMLREGMTAADVAKHIQETFELLQDVSGETLQKALQRRRKALPPPPPSPEDWPAVYSPEEDSSEARTPGKLARAQYQRAVMGIDLLLETEGLYLAQRDRIDRMMRAESRSGTHYEEMPREMGAALDMLKTHAKLQEQFGPATARLKMNLEIQGGATTGLGQKVSSTMQNPGSRHKVLSFFKKLSQVADLPPAIIDGEAEPVGGV